MDKDHCTWFPEYWITWKGEYVYIGWMCKKHDNSPEEGEEFEGCASTGFYSDTWNARLVGAVTIATIASIACWIKYTKEQIGRI